MSIDIKKAVRKPFEAEAVQVTAENMEQVALWCHGEIIVENADNQSLRQYIKVETRNPMNEKQTQAHVSNWVLFANGSFMIYTNKAFRKGFEVKEPKATIKETYEGTKRLFEEKTSEAGKKINEMFEQRPPTEES